MELSGAKKCQILYKVIWLKFFLDETYIEILIPMLGSYSRKNSTKFNLKEK